MSGISWVKFSQALKLFGAAKRSPTEVVEKLCKWLNVATIKKTINNEHKGKGGQPGWKQAITSDNCGKQENSSSQYMNKTNTMRRCPLVVKLLTCWLCIYTLFCYSVFFVLLFFYRESIVVCNFRGVGHYLINVGEVSCVKSFDAGRAKTSDKSIQKILLWTHHDASRCIHLNEKCYYCYNY